MPLFFEEGAIPQPSKMHKIVGRCGVADIQLFSLKGIVTLKELLQIFPHLSAGHLMGELGKQVLSSKIEKN